MELLRDYLLDERAEILDNGIRLEALGDVERLPPLVREPLEELRAASRSNSKMVLTLALSYGGRESITRAARARGPRHRAPARCAAEDLDCRSARRRICRPPGCRRSICSIRTSGEQRVSNFMLWELAYAELVFVDVLWPEFRREHLYSVSRVRRARAPLRADVGAACRFFGRVVSCRPLGTRQPRAAVPGRGRRRPDPAGRPLLPPARADVGADLRRRRCSRCASSSA